MTTKKAGIRKPGGQAEAGRGRRRGAKKPDSAAKGKLVDGLLVERMNDGLIVLDERHRVSYVNTKLCELLGISADEILGRSPADYLDEKSRGLFAAKLETRTKGERASYEVEWLTQSGAPLITIVTPQPLFDQAGTYRGSFAVLTDISERKKAEAQLRADVEHLRSILEATSGGVWDWDIPSGRMVFSPKYSRMLGYEPEEFAKHYDEWRMIVHPDDIERVKQAHADHFDKNKTFSVEFRMQEKSGRWHWVHSRGILLERDARGRPKRMVGTHQDIQERKNAELEGDRLRGELAVVNRRIQLGELASSLAHELNQPLGAIMNNAEAGRALLERPVQDLDEIREILSEIIRDDMRAAEVIRKMRGLVKRKEMVIEPLAVGLLIHDVLDLSRGNLALNSVSVALEEGPDLPAVLGDRVHLQQVLLNLITNAIEAMREAPEKRLLLRAVETDARTLTVSVVDSGPGVGAPAIDSIFTPFYTTKPDGLGMGLAICRSIIEAHGGRIWAEDSPTGGAMFLFSLKTKREPAL